MKTIHLYRITLTALTTLIVTISSIPAFPAIFQVSQVLAQTENSQQAEADRLRHQGFNELNNKQFTNARQSWQKALTIYQEIKDRKKESFLLFLLGMTYLQQSDYTRHLRK